jgi:hypothetical protein
MNVYLHICIFFSQYSIYIINVFACRDYPPDGRKYAKNGTKVCSFFTTNYHWQKAVYQGKAP